MDKHYTDRQIRDAVFSPYPVDDEMLGHILSCRECGEKFTEISQQLSVSAPPQCVADTIKRVSMRKRRINDMAYNLRVVFAVSVAMFMLFAIPVTPERGFDIVRHNHEKISSMTEKKEEFREDVSESFEKFIEFYTKGNTDNDTTEK